MVNLYKTFLETPLGEMIVIADNMALYFLGFADQSDTRPHRKRIRQSADVRICSGRTQPIDTIEQELGKYFSGQCTVFTTPTVLNGSVFENRVWSALAAIPIGKTCSYGGIAAAIGKPSAYRAVAQANGKNQLAILIPCHRVINANGNLGGYSSGIERKKWLLDHEKNGFSTT